MRILLILGHRLNDDGTISEILKRRLDKSIELLQNICIDKIICSGGTPCKKAKISEAKRMSEYLINHNIDKKLLIEEDKSLNTIMNIIYSKKIIKILTRTIKNNNNINNKIEVYLLSSNYHLNRKIFNPVKLYKFFIHHTKLEIVGVA